MTMNGRIEALERLRAPAKRYEFVVQIAGRDESDVVAADSQGLTYERLPGESVTDLTGRIPRCAPLTVAVLRYR